MTRNPAVEPAGGAIEPTGGKVPSYGPPSYSPEYGPGHGQPAYGSGYGPGYGPAHGMPGMRAAATDRERTLDVLKAAYGEGRLTKAEFESRTARTMAARYYGELAAIVADLPAGPLVHPAPGYYPAGPVAPTNGLAAASLVCSLVGMLLAPMLIPGVILGHIAREQIRRSDQRGEGFATAGLVFGYVGIVIWAFIIYWIVTVVA